MNAIGRDIALIVMGRQSGIFLLVGHSALSWALGPTFLILSISFSSDSLSLRSLAGYLGPDGEIQYYF